MLTHYLSFKTLEVLPPSLKLPWTVLSHCPVMRQPTNDVKLQKVWVGKLSTISFTKVWTQPFRPRNEISLILSKPCWSSPFQQQQLPPRPGSETFPSRTRLSAPPPPPERMSFIFSFNESIHIDDAWHWNPSDPIRLWTTWWRSSWVCSSSTSPRNSATSSWTLLLQIVTGFWKSNVTKPLARICPVFRCSASPSMPESAASPSN